MSGLIFGIRGFGIYARCRGRDCKGRGGPTRTTRRQGQAQCKSLPRVKVAENSQRRNRAVAVDSIECKDLMQFRSNEDRIVADNPARPEKTQAENSAHAKRVVVLSLDYDNCMDVLFEATELRLRRRRMTKEVEVMDRVRSTVRQDLLRITAGASRVILMVGSNRQSFYVDQFNREKLEREIGPIRSEVGWVRHDFQNLAEEMGWELNRALLADKENDAPPGTAWNNNDLQVKFELGMDKHIKRNLIQYQFEQLRNVEGNIDFYFFDDKSQYLDFVRWQVAVPSSIQFFTVHFDWFTHIVEGKPMDLHAMDTEDQPQSLDTRQLQAS